MLTLSAAPSFSRMHKTSEIQHPKFGEAPQYTASAELISAWEKTSHDFIELIKPQIPNIQKENRAFKDATSRGDQKAAQKHFEATIDHIGTLIGSTLQAMKSKLPEIMTLQQSSPEQKKQISNHINRTLTSKFQELAQQTAQANAPKLNPELAALIDKAVTKSVDAVKPELPAFIKARQDFQAATQKFMIASEKSMKEVFSTVSKELPKSLEEQQSSLEYNRQVAEYSRQLVKQKLAQATEAMMKKSTVDGGA